MHEPEYYSVGLIQSSVSSCRTYLFWRNRAKMADNGDYLKGSVQETGDRQVSELALHRQPSGTDAEIPPVTKKLAEFITALLVLLYNLLRRFRALGRTTARTVLQYMQTPPVDIEGRDKMKRDGEQIKVNLKEICHEESKLREKVNFHFQDAHSLILLNLSNDRAVVAFYPYFHSFFRNFQQKKTNGITNFKRQNRNKPQKCDTKATTAMNVTDSTHPTIFMCYYYYQHPFYHQYHYMATNVNYYNNCLHQQN